MKKYIILLSASFLFSCNNGEIIEEWGNGNIRIERYKVDRSRDFEIHYYQSGKKKKEGYTKNGYLDSNWKGWHSNGNLEFEMSFEKGKPFSNYTKYYENGLLKEKGTYDEDGLLDDMWKEEYYSNGCVKRIGNRQNGKWTTWHNCDIMESITYYKNGEKDSTFVSYWDTKGIRVKVNYENGMKQGKYTEWYENGEAAEEGMYKDDKRTGEWKEYWSSGNKKSIGKYRDGIKNEKWISWYDDGSRHKVEFWRRGELELIDYWEYKGKKIVRNGNGRVPSELAPGNYDYYRNRVMIPVKQKK